MIKLIYSYEDIDKIVDGDIGVFKYVVSNMIPVIRRCAGTVGLRGYGAMTGHLAIVSRELDIPCVVNCESDWLSDGQFVYLDGSNGEIRIILSTEELKEIIR